MKKKRARRTETIFFSDFASGVKKRGGWLVSPRLGSPILSYSIPFYSTTLLLVVVINFFLEKNGMKWIISNVPSLLLVLPGKRE